MRVRTLKLTSVNDIRRLLSKTINELRNDEISYQTANTIGSLSNILLKTIQATSLEDRITNLENSLGIEGATSAIPYHFKSQREELKLLNEATRAKA